jgi:hypothetical protein
VPKIAGAPWMRDYAALVVGARWVARHKVLPGKEVRLTARIKGRQRTASRQANATAAYVNSTAPTASEVSMDEAPPGVLLPGRRSVQRF